MAVEINIPNSKNLTDSNLVQFQWAISDCPKYGQTVEERGFPDLLPAGYTVAHSLIHRVCGWLPASGR